MPCPGADSGAILQFFNALGEQLDMSDTGEETDVKRTELARSQVRGCERGVSGQRLGHFLAGYTSQGRQTRDFPSQLARLNYFRRKHKCCEI